MINDNSILLRKKGEIIADASSIIYLDKIGLLKKYHEIKTILTPEPIYDELIFKSNSKNYSEYIKIVKPPKSRRMVKENSTILKYPDVTLITIYKTYKTDGILTDDGKICRYCLANNISYINTPMAIFSLKLCNIISLSEFYEKLDEIYEIGRYSKKVRDYMKFIIKKQIIYV